MTVSADDFVRELRAYMREQEKAPLYGESFFAGVMAGTMSREALKKWAIQHHYRTGQHVRAFGGVFLNTGLSPLDQKLRRHIVENLIDEETPMGRGDDAHWALSRRLAEALGATAEELAHPTVARAAIDYVEWVLALSRREYGLVTLAAMSIGGESRREDSLARLAQALAEKYGVSREALEFFYAHMGEAEAHGEPVYQMVREYATTPERQEKIRVALQQWCEKFRAAQEGIFRVAMGLEEGIEVSLSPV
ncbi:MAG: iron-containing redox enzyme family protein [Candidatus Binatia bacterium]|nr:iron-containing redox enzyme family protein [Candidatus Binatia bacterium]